MKKFNITVNGQAYEVEVEEVGAAAPQAVSAPKAAPAPAPKAAPAAAPAPAPKAASAPAGAATVNAPMPGKILDVKVKAGDGVKRGDVLLILEAMKMQNEIMAPADGKISAVQVTVGQTVSTGDVMIVMG